MVSVCREGLVLFSTGEKGYASFFSRILKTANPMREDCIDIMLIWEFKNVRFSKYGEVTGSYPSRYFLTERVSAMNLDRKSTRLNTLSLHDALPIYAYLGIQEC